VAGRAGGAECERPLSGSLSPRSPSLRFPSPPIGRVEDWRGTPKDRPVGLEFLVRRRREAGRGPYGGRPGAHGPNRPASSCALRRRLARVALQ
jgi:hypothetical protein